MAEEKKKKRGCGRQLVQGCMGLIVAFVILVIAGFFVSDDGDTPSDTVDMVSTPITLGSPVPAAAVSRDAPTDIPTPTERPLPTNTPIPSPTTDPMLLAQVGINLILVQNGVDVSSVEIVDGRENGGELITIVAFVTTEERIFSDFGAIMGAVYRNSEDYDLDMDAISMIYGPNRDTTSAIAVVQYSDVVLLQNEQITAEVFFDRIEFTDF